MIRISNSIPTRQLASNEVTCLNGFTQWSLTSSGDDQDRVVVFPFFNTVPNTLNEVRIRLSTATPGLTYHLGFYLLDGANGRPKTLIANCGSVDASTNGQKSFTDATFRLPLGRVGLAMLAKGAAGSASFQYAITNESTISQGFSRLSCGWSQANVASLPNELNASDYDPYAPPAIWAKAV